MTDLNSIEISSTVDARGSACPGPLLEAKKGIGKVKVGEVLEIYSNDSGTRTDIPAWSNKVGHEYLGILNPMVTINILSAEANRWGNGHCTRCNDCRKDTDHGNRNLCLSWCGFRGAGPFDLPHEYVYSQGARTGPFSGAVLPGLL